MLAASLRSGGADDAAEALVSVATEARLGVAEDMLIS